MMKPQKIRALLIEQGEKQINIARDLNVSHDALNMVIDGKFVSRRIRHAIAEKACMPFEKMWGKPA